MSLGVCCEGSDGFAHLGRGLHDSGLQKYKQKRKSLNQSKEREFKNGWIGRR